MSLLRSFCRLPCVRRAGKRRCEGGSSGPSLSSSCPFFQHHLGLASLPPRLFSSPTGGPLFSRRFAGKTAPRPGAAAARIASVLSACAGGFFLWAPAGRTAPVGQPRRAWMSPRSDTRRWSCCCFASPCGYCNTIQPEQTPSFTSVRLEPERKRAERRPEIDYCGMLCCSAATLSIWGLWWGGVGNLTV